MRRFAQYIAVCATLVLSLLSCRVHVWPNEPIPSVEVELTLTFDTDMPEHAEITRAAKSIPAENYALRYIVKAYPVASDNSIIKSEVLSDVWSKEDLTQHNEQHKLMLPPGKYRLYAWVDYVDKNSLEDKFYDTGSEHGFGMVSLIMHEPKQSLGNNHFRNIFIGNTLVEVDEMYELGLPSVKANIEMSQPLAMFQFVTTDIDEFVRKELQEREKRAAENGVILPESELQPSSIDLSQYKVIIQYNDFMPTAFDLFENQPTNSDSGVTFTSYITTTSGNEALLGFDYTFILNDYTEEGTHPRFSLYVYNTEDKLLSAAKDIAVPLHRGKYTTIKGTFLTMQASGGVNINPDFKNEHNIIIGN